MQVRRVTAPEPWQQHMKNVYYFLNVRTYLCTNVFILYTFDTALERAKWISINLFIRRIEIQLVHTCVCVGGGTATTTDMRVRYAIAPGVIRYNKYLIIIIGNVRRPITIIVIGTDVRIDVTQLLICQVWRQVSENGGRGGFPSGSEFSRGPPKFSNNLNLQKKTFN